MLSTLKTLPVADFSSSDFLSAHPLPTWIVDTNDLSILFANTSASQHYGFGMEEFYHLSLLDLFSEESRLFFFRMFSRNEEAAALNASYRHLKKDGTVITVSLHFSSLFHNGMAYYQVSAVDITRQVEAQTALEGEARKYYTFIEQSSEGIFCLEFKSPCSIHTSPAGLMECVRKNSYISECNDAMARMYGFEKAEDLKGMLSDQLLDYSDEANTRCLQAFVSDGFRMVNAESREQDRSGNTRYFLRCAIGIVENGYLKRIWGTQQDITDNKKTEDKLQLLAQLVEQTSDVLTAADLHFNPMTWNAAAERIYGLTASQVLGKSVRDLIDVHYSGTDRDTVRRMIREHGEWRGESFFIRPTDKKLVTLWISFKLLKDEKNKPLGYLVSATDITKRKEAELRIKESESHFREMADSSPAMIWICDENNVVSYINKKWMEFTGRNITGDPAGWSSLVHPDDLTRARTKFQEAFSSRKPITVAYRLVHSDGTYRWVQDVSVPRFSNGAFIGYIGSVLDIEDQKQKEQQLVYQATILENVSDILVTTDLEGQVMAWNKTAETYYEIKEEDALGKKVAELVQFDFHGATPDQVTTDLHEKGFWEGEVSRRNSIGTLHYFSHTIKYICDATGNRIGFLTVGRDITATKLAEEETRKSEQFYRTLIADSLDGMILIDEKGDITFASPSVKNVLGYEVEDVLGRNGFEFIHPEDLLWAAQSLQKEIDENPDVKFIVVRLLKKNGEWLWCMLRGNNMLKNPSIRSVVLYFHDDTLRKEASDALRKSEKRFKDLIRDLQIGVILQDKEGKTLLCNKAFAEIFDIDQEKIMGTPIESIALDPLHEDGSKYLPEERPTSRAIRTRQPARDVVMGIYRPKKNDRVWILINVDPIMDQNGEVDHLICSVKDITERKKLEAEMLGKKISHQKQLTQATLDGQEAERKEIGKELHDNIGQQLTTIKLFLDLVKPGTEGPAAEMLSMAVKGICDVINEIRSMSRSLVPPTLQDLGLVESINELTHSITRTQFLHIVVDHREFDEALLAENQKLSLFRIIQEQLNNIVKHSGARNVKIRLANPNGEVLLEIKDDGKGFELPKLKKGLGFINIRNRAELFGGKKEIIAAPGEGCLLRVSFPQSGPGRPILPAS